MFVIGCWSTWDHLDSCHTDNCTEKLSSGTSVPRKNRRQTKAAAAPQSQQNLQMSSAEQGGSYFLLCLLSKSLFIYSFLFNDAFSAPSRRSALPADVLMTNRCLLICFSFGHLTDLTIPSMKPKQEEPLLRFRNAQWANVLQIYASLEKFLLNCWF